jgi:tetratricopeptide (TPR) repeat protein
MKCLEKDRNRRYETANGLARDIERYLHDEPVQACPPSALYRLRMFARRHRGPVLAASIILVLLIAAIVGTTMGLVLALRAERRTAEQRQIAQENLRLALKGLDAIYLQVAEERLPRDPQRKKEDIRVLKKALDFYQQFAQQNRMESAEGLEVSRAYRRVGDIQVFVGENLAAEDAYRLAIAQAQNLVESSPKNPDSIAELAANHIARGELLLSVGRNEPSGEGFPQAIGGLSPLVTQLPTVPEYREALARAQRGLANVLKQRGDRAAAETHYQEALAIQTKLAEELPAVVKYRADLAKTYQHAGWWPYQGWGEPQTAYLRRACELLRDLVRDFPSDPGYRHQLAINLRRLADAPGFENRKDSYLQAIDLEAKLASEFPTVPDYRANLGASHNELGICYWREDDRKPAAEHFRKGLEIYTKLTADFPDVIGYQENMSTCETSVAETTISLGEDPGQACKLLESATGRLERLVKDYPNNEGFAFVLTCTSYFLSDTLSCLGQAPEANRRLKQAEQVFTQTLNRLCQAPEQQSAAVSFCNDLFWEFKDHAKVWRAAGKANLADNATAQSIEFLGRLTKLKPAWSAPAELLNNLAWLLATSADARLRNPTEAVTLAKKAVEADPKQGKWWNTLGAAQYRAGDWLAAVEALTRSMELRRGGDSLDWFFLAMAYWQQGKKDDAREWYDKAALWMEKNRSKDEELSRFRAEAAALLQLKK